MNLFTKVGFLVVLMSFSTGCATILSGKSQTITLNTNPAGARCELIREGRIVGTVETTPGAVTLDKTKHDIDVVCKKAGYSESRAFAESGTEGATFGNIILGGGIGWAIDSAAGADNKYPEVVTVNMVPNLNTSSSKSQSKKSSSSNNNEKRLVELKKLREDGILTEEEYQLKRSEVVKRL